MGVGVVMVVDVWPGLVSARDEVNGGEDAGRGLEVGDSDADLTEDFARTVAVVRATVVLDVSAVDVVLLLEVMCDVVVLLTGVA